MNFIQFVAPLIGGYWFLWEWNYTKFVVKEDSGYHLFFKSSIAGMFFLMLANILTFSVNIVVVFFNFDTASSFLNEINALVPNGFDPASILAMIIGILSPYILNKRSSSSKHLTRAAIDRGNYLFLMTQEAFDKSVMMEVTLNSGKVYIGPTLSEMPFESKYLQLVPYLSGYRENETKKLIVSRKNTERIKSILDANPVDFDQALLRNLRIIVPTKDIASARLFDPEIYEKLNPSDS